MDQADGARPLGRTPRRGRAAIRRGVVIATLTAVAMSLAPSTAAARRPGQDVIVVQAANPASFGDPTPECPAGVGTLALAGPRGRPAGTARTCIQAFIETGPTSVTVRTAFTMSLRRGDIVLDLTIAERFFDEAPGVVFQDFSGTVTGGTRAYRGRTGSVFGGGSLTFNPDGTLTPDATFIVVLDRRR